MKKMKRMMGIFAALAVLALGGCSDAGETSAEIEEIRGPESAASSETALTGDDAVSRAETFIEGIAPGVFGVSLRNPEPEEIDGTAVYVMNLQVDGNLDAASYEPTLAVDASSGVIYSYYQDGDADPGGGG